MNITIYKDDTTKMNPVLETLVLNTQSDLKEYLSKKFDEKKTFEGDGYLYYEGSFPVLLCAHMDTVHERKPKTLVYARNTLSSPQGIGADDRCGIYMILEILKKYDCSVLFLEDEEIGCVGARKFTESALCGMLQKQKKLKYIIEFDRKGKNHAVFYNCANDKFTEFVTQEFFVKEYGTCSDISYIAPTLGIAAVNLSCGYYKEHNLEEWVNLKEMETIIAHAMILLEKTKNIDKPFEYIKGNSYSGRYYGGYGYYDGYYDDYYDGYYNGTYQSRNQSRNYSIAYLEMDNNFKKVVTKVVSATSEAEAFYSFCKSNVKVCYYDIINIKEV